MIAQVIVGGYSIVNLLILAIVVAAVIGITVIIVRQMGVPIPDWIVKIFWIVVAVLVGIFAIKLVLSAL